MIYYIFTCIVSLVGLVLVVLAGTFLYWRFRERMRMLKHCKCAQAKVPTSEETL